MNNEMPLQVDDDDDIDSRKTCVLLLIYIRNSYALEEAKLIKDKNDLIPDL